MVKFLEEKIIPADSPATHWFNHDKADFSTIHFRAVAPNGQRVEGAVSNRWTLWGAPWSIKITAEEK